MPECPPNDTHQKALRINLDPTIFGSFAEIGAGQEVARWFLRVGAASGTVAKSISAYDKDVSDDLYGKGTRYVSRERLEAMLDREWEQLRAQVSGARGGATRLFAFADTVAARNYEGTNDAQGWMGVRFQLRPGEPPGDVLLHVNMRDHSGVQQQEALGILGVNLLHALYYERDSEDQFLDALRSDLEDGRLEIDLIDFAGNGPGWKREPTLARLLTRGMAEAVVFAPGERPPPPSEIVYKKAVVLVPGTFDHVAPIHARILAAGTRELERELAAAGEQPPPKLAGAFCLSAAAPDDATPAPDASELAARAAALIPFGAPVIAARRREYYHMTALINRYTHAPVRFAVGISALLRVFAEAHYGNLEGRILEGVSRLFAGNVRFYVYPMPAAEMRRQFETLAGGGWRLEAPEGMVTVESVRPPDPLGNLYDYLLHSGFMAPMRGA